MKCVLVDNEDQIREGLKTLVQSFCPQLEIIGEANGVTTGIRLILEKKPELVFLDVEMDDGTGMDLLKTLPTRDFQVIFVTAHDKYAVNAFRFAAIDFLLKPVDPEVLIEAVGRAMEGHKKASLDLRLEALTENLDNLSKKNRKLVLRDAENIHILQVEEIAYLEADGNYTRFHTKTGESILVSKNLKEYEKILDDPEFFRPHKSYLVNLANMLKIEKEDGGYLILEGGGRVPVSTRKRKDLLERIGSI